MRVLVTGAAGRVGANLVKRLLSAGIEVRAMVMPGDPLANRLAAFPEAEVMEADLRDQQAINAACAGGITHIVHLAAQLVRGNTPVDAFYDVNAFGTLRLLEGAVHAGGLERFVLISTEGTYRPGAPPRTPLTEDTPQVPGEYYGTSKLLGEIILRNHAAQYDLPFTIVRFPTVMSPEEAPNFFRLRSMRGLLSWQAQGRTNHIWHLFAGQPDLVEILERQAGDAPDDTAAGLVGPDGPWRLSMVDVRDAVEGVHLALTRDEALGRAFNIAGAEATPYDEGASIVAETFGVPKLMIEVPMTWRLELSIDLARELLGYEPKYDFAAMVAAANASSAPSDAAYIPAGTSSGVGSLR